MTEEQKNRDFIQLYRDHVDDVARLAREQPRAYDLFMLLIKHMDGTNALCVSMQALTEIMALSRQSLSKSVKYLKDNGWVCVMRNGSSNVYIVNPDVAWTSYGNQKQYCKFQANVLLSSSENAEYLNSPYKPIESDMRKNVKYLKQCNSMPLKRI